MANFCVSLCELGLKSLLFFIFIFFSSLNSQFYTESQKDKSPKNTLIHESSSISTTINFGDSLVRIWFFTTSQRFWPYFKPLLLWVPIWENLAYHCLLAKSMVVLMLELSCIRVFLGELSFWLSVYNWLFKLLKKIK